MRIASATLFGTIIYFVIGWLVFEVLLGRFMAEHTTGLVGFRKEGGEASLPMLLVSCLAYALLLALICEQWAHIATFKDGLFLGAVIGMLVAVMTDSYWFSTTHYFKSILPVGVDVLAAGLTVGIMGGAIAWCLNALRQWM